MEEQPSRRKGGFSRSRHCRPLRRLAFEPLETRQLLSAATAGAGPSDLEQYLLELINRARANPVEEALLFGLSDLNEGITDPEDRITGDPKQPLAFNPNLGDAAGGHSDWMLATGTFSHTGAGDSSPYQRAVDAGYVFVAPAALGENIAWETADGAGAVADLHRLLFVDATVPGRGHRLNLLDEDYREIGVGVASLGETYVTEDFAYSGTSVFLTGVVYDETRVADNRFYDPGEGLGGVLITATRTSDGQQFTTTTWDSGGYTLALPAGTYLVSASGGELGTTVALPNPVTIGTQNVKVDFQRDAGAALPPNAKAGGSYVVDEGGTVTLDGSASSDPIEPQSALVFQWDLDGDGVFGETGAAAARGSETGMRPVFSAANVWGPATITVSLRVVNSSGSSDVDTATILVRTNHDTIGAYDPGTGWWRLNATNGQFGADAIDFYLSAGSTVWKPIVGDWDGDGRDTIGLYDPYSARFLLWNSNSTSPGAAIDFAFHVRLPDWVPLVGDWNGDGIDTIGLYDPFTAHFYLKNSNNANPGDVIDFGFNVRLVGWHPLVGDWNGDGVDTIGLYDPNSAHFYLKDSNNAWAGDVTHFGFNVRLPGWLPLVGDWDRDGVSTIGLYDPGSAHWYLKNRNDTSAADLIDFVAGSQGWAPLAGNWRSAGGADRAGLASACLDRRATDAVYGEFREWLWS
jgi:hypothetical protein